jgi:REP element-mobilizing transposase RayT
MSNVKRYYETNATYFLTTNTENSLPVFSDSKNCKILLVTLEYFKLVLDYRLYGFCIMPTHLHLVIHPFGTYNFSYIMKMIKGSFTRKLNKANGKTGKIWQKGFYDECIRDEMHLLRVLEYIHNNPLKAGLAMEPEEYLFSSYSHYFQTANQTNQIVEIDKPML